VSDSRVDAYAARLERWHDEFAALRTILADTGLTEEFKWYKPCYTHGGKNIAIFQPFDDRCALMFFKGALLDDPKALLREQGSNSRSSLRLEFRSVGEVTRMRSAVRGLVADAIRVEQAGVRVEKPAPPTHRGGASRSQSPQPRPTCALTPERGTDHCPARRGLFV